MRSFCADITATQAALLLEMNRKTINRYYNAFRQAVFAFQEEQKEAFVGTVEVDESYFGRTRPRGVHKKLKRGRGTKKQPVFAIFERGGRVYTEVVPDAKKRTLQRVIRGQVELDSVIISDGWRGYNGLVDAALTSIYASANTRTAKHGSSKTASKASGRLQNAASPSSTA